MNYKYKNVLFTSVTREEKESNEKECLEDYFSVEHRLSVKDIISRSYVDNKKYIKYDRDSLDFIRYKIFDLKFDPKDIKIYSIFENIKCSENYTIKQCMILIVKKDLNSRFMYDREETDNDTEVEYFK